MERKRQILIVVNPISGNINKDRLVMEVQQHINNAGDNFKVFKTTGQDDKKNLAEIINQLPPDRILVAGGDGTIKLVAEVIDFQKTSIGIIPAGSANGLAVNLGITRFDLQTQIKIALGEKLLDCDVLEINGDYCLHMSDFGINAELIKNYEASRIRGKFGYLLQSIPTLINSKYPFEFDIELPDNHFSRKGILLAVANASRYGTGANVNPKGKLDDGIFEILVFKNFDIIGIIKTLRNETEIDPGFVEVIPATSAKVSCRKPISFQIDGEYIGERSEINVKVLTEKLKIAVN